MQVVFIVEGIECSVPTQNRIVTFPLILTVFFPIRAVESIEKKEERFYPFADLNINIRRTEMPRLCDNG